MDSDRWSRVNDLVGRALEHPSAERAAFLAGACPDREVRQEAASLLALESGVLADLERPPAPLLDEVPAIEPGERIGAYRVLRELGRGGMGVVYLAERADREYERRVAVKVLKPGIDTCEVVRRFRTERQILANLEHPGIAELYEGGTTGDGRPYFVMEHVEGEPIVAWCDARGLGVRPRLELFRKVCDAVQLAHRNLVVHRDLKPANIPVDASGQPKLLDFGIAKLLDPEGGDGAPQTALDLRPMTPEYASPEQVLGAPVTTATDVYALGVLLFELLTGGRPYRFNADGARPCAAELRRAVCEEPPLAPSAAIGRGDPRRRQLAGDLDNIVAKALAKVPRDRYPSVDQLSEDVGRHLRGLPVRARRPTLRYRAGKLLRRRWREAAALCLAGALLAAFLVDREMQRRRTARALTRAERVTEFLVDLFEVSEPGEGMGGSVTAREVLDRGARRVRSELEREPEVQTALMGTIGRVYRRLGLYQDAEAMLREALALPARATGDDGPEALALLGDLGEVLYLRGELEEAEATLRRARERGRALGVDELRLAGLDHGLAQVLQARGASEEADALYERVLALRRARLGDEHPDTLESFNDLAVQRFSEGDAPEAERLLRQVLASRRRVLGAGHPQVAKSANNLAVLLEREGDTEEAGRLYREALALHRRALGDDHPDTVTSEAILGQFLAARGDFRAAEPLLRDALARHRLLLGDGHPEVAADLRELSVLLGRTGRYEEAEARAREALGIARAKLGDEHLAVAVLWNNLGAVLVDEGEEREAEEVLTRALALYRARLGADSGGATSPLHHLAALRRARGDLEGAERLYREALAIRRAGYPEDHPRVASTLTQLAGLLLARGRAREAEELAREAVDIDRSAYEPGYWALAQAEGVLGEALLRLGRPAEAEPLLVRSQAALRDSLGELALETREAGRRLDELRRAAPGAAGAS